MSERRTQKWWREHLMAESYAHLRSPVLLRAHMDHKGVTATTLARQASYHRIANGHPKVSRQMISLLLHAGELDGHGKPKGLASCSVSLGQAIESALDVPDGVLFDVRPKSSHKRETAKADAA